MNQKTKTCPVKSSPYFTRIIFFILMAVAIVFNLPQKALAAGETVTTLTILEKAGVTTNNYPLTFGHVFKDGDVGSSVSVKVGGQVLPTQCDVKRHYDDGSVKYAVVSVVLPEVQANQSLTLEIINGGAQANSGELTKEQISSTDTQSLLELTNLSDSNYSGSRTANLRDAINNTANLNYWLKGPVTTEAIVTQDILDDSARNQMDARWEVRFYPGTSFGPRISNSIENVNSQLRGNVDYAVNIKYGNSNPVSVYSKSIFQHNINSRWRKVIWVGNEPPETEVHYNLPYLISTGVIMNYDTSLSVPENTLSSAYSSWQATDNDIMGEGDLQTYFPTTGGRQDIGILPTWTARYLLSMDNRMKKIMLNNAEMASGTPIHYKEMDNTKSFLGHSISIDDRPTIWLGNENYTYTAVQDRLPTEIGTAETQWTVDRSHQASFAFVPYLITGEYYYLEELYYWANYNLGASNYNSDYGRDYARGLIRDQVRGEAWAIRNIADAAAFAVDTDVEKNYFGEKVNNNLEAWVDKYINNSSSPLHSWGGVSCRPSDGGRSEESIIGCTTSPTGTGSGVYNEILPINSLSSPWMDDFVLVTLKHLEQLGFDTTNLIHWAGEFVINRFTNPDFNPYDGADYRLAYKYTPTYDVLSPSYYVQSWSQANDSIIAKETSFPTDDYATSYRFIALAAASCVADYANGQAAYNWLKANVNDQDELNIDPTWAIVPTGTLTTDSVPPAAPQNLSVF